jgi:hypothetical protein
MCSTEAAARGSSAKQIRGTARTRGLPWAVRWGATGAWNAWPAAAKHNTAAVRAA